MDGGASGPPSLLYDETGQKKLTLGPTGWKTELTACPSPALRVTADVQPAAQAPQPFAAFPRASPWLQATGTTNMSGSHVGQGVAPLPLLHPMMPVPPTRTDASLSPFMNPLLGAGAALGIPMMDSSPFVLLERYKTLLEAKNTELATLKRRVSTMEKQLQRDTLWSVNGGQVPQAQQELLALRELVPQLTESNGRLVQEIARAKDALLKAGMEFLPDLVPVKITGEVTPYEVQQALTGFVSKQTLEEAVAAVDAAIRDPLLEPFKVVHGGIVDVDLDHPSLQHIIERFGRKLAILVAEKRREVISHCPRSKAPVMVMWDGDRELHLTEVVQRLLNELRSLKVPAAPPPVTMTSSGRRVTANPRFNGHDADSQSTRSQPHLGQPPSAGSPSAGVVSAPFSTQVSGADTPVSGDAEASSRGTTPKAQTDKRKRRARAPIVLHPDVREALKLYMKRHSTMSEASCSMFSGAANALIFRVLAEVHGEEHAAQKQLDFLRLKEVTTEHADVFERETKDAYANLPRIWKLLQGFAALEDMHIDKETAVFDAVMRGEEHVADRDWYGMSVEPTEGRYQAAEGSSSVEGSYVSLGDLPRLCKQTKRTSDTLDELDDDAVDDGPSDSRAPTSISSDPRAVLRCAASAHTDHSVGKDEGGVGGSTKASAEQQPRVYDDDDSDSDYDLKGIIFGLPPKAIPVVAEPSKRRGAVSAAKQRPQALPVPPRKAIPIVLGEDVRQGFVGYMRLYTKNRGSSLSTIFRAVNNFMARVITRYRQKAQPIPTPLSVEGLQKLVDSHGTSLAAEVNKSSNLSLRTFWRHLVRFLREANHLTLPAMRAAGNLDENSSLPHNSALPPLPPRKPAALPMGQDIGPHNVPGGKGEKSRKRKLVRVPFAPSEPSVVDVDEEELGHAYAASPPSGPASSLYGEESSSPEDHGRAAKKARRGSASVIAASVRNAFHSYLQTHTQMQAGSMVTAQRTANRVIHAVLVKHRGPDGTRELSIEEVNGFIKEHKGDFLREVARTANVSVRTFWRHFLRFIGGEKAVNDFNQDLVILRIQAKAATAQSVKTDDASEGNRADVEDMGSVGAYEDDEDDDDVLTS